MKLHYNNPNIKFTGSKIAKNHCYLAIRVKVNQKYPKVTQSNPQLTQTYPQVAQKCPLAFSNPNKPSIHPNIPN